MFKNKKRGRETPIKFHYLKTSPFMIKTINLLGLLSSLFMLSGLIIIGLNNLYYFLLFLPLIIVFFFYYSSHYIFNLFYKRINSFSHSGLIDSYWKENKNTAPPVDIFITYSGEGIDIIRETCIAAKDIGYDNKKVFLLDDSGDDNVRTLMQELGINYICRPDRGYMKKAGNLTHALNRTDGEFVAIFDADFVPDGDFLRELMPYFNDAKVGLIQSPQFFITKDKGNDFITSGSAALQEDFYRIIQPARNLVHGAICVGTNLIYRRSALKDAGGIAYVPWCEDLETGFNITISGYHILYLPIILARGRCPDNPQSFFNQHRRWCYSSLRLLFTRKMFGSKLHFLTRLSYISNIFYYFSEAFSILAILIFSIIMIFDKKLIDTGYFIFFLPYFIFLLLIQPLSRRRILNIGSFITSALESFSYLYTMLAMIVTREMNWVPSNTREGSVSTHFFNFIIFTGLILSIEIYNIINMLFLNPRVITFRQWTTYVFAGWFLMIILIQAFVFIYIAVFAVLKNFTKASNKRSLKIQGGSNASF